MSLGIFLYKSLTMILSPFLGVFFRRRARSGKEDVSRISERFVRNVPPRPSGPVVWLHAASVGESQLLLELVRRLTKREDPSVLYLFTCQTQTAAGIVENALATDTALSNVVAIQQMAPVDTPANARRFLDHWSPGLAIFAEGEIWPNLLLELQRRQTPAALINARMTEKSISGWLRWPSTARRIFGSFDLVLCADVQTQTGLQALSGSTIDCPGNLKSALPAPSGALSELEPLRREIGERPVLLAASTHPGEEALALDAYLQINPKPFLIIAPRHPERGDEIAGLLSCTEYSVSRRSAQQPVAPDTDILLADTMGEMGLWYRLADAVYLGGGHAPGVGGHNPLEALQLGKPIMTGPSLFNFRDMTDRLKGYAGFRIVDDALALARAFPAEPVAPELTEILARDALGPMSKTLAALAPLLPGYEA